METPKANPNAGSRLSYPMKVLLTVTSVALLVNYVETMVIPGIPTIQAHFSSTDTIASWITSAFLIVGAAVSPLFGKLGDIYGKKKIFLTVLLFYIVGVGLAGFSTSIYMLIASRAVQGIGFAIVPLGLAIITDIFPKERVATAQGIISGTFAIGAAAGLIIGAYIVQDLSWEWAFHTAFIMSIILFLVAAVMLKKDVPGEKSKVDIAGASMLMAGVVLVLLYLTEAPSLGWLSLENLAFFVVGVVLTVGFFVFENKQTSPLIHLKLLKIRNVLVANLVGILSTLSMFLLFFAVIYYAQYPKPYGLGLSIINTGLTLAPATLVMLIVGPIMGRLVTRIGPKPILVLGASVSILGLLQFTFFRATTVELTIDVAVALIGVVSLIIPIVNMIAMSVPKENTAVGLGMNTMLRNLGGAIGPVLATTIISTYYDTVKLPAPPYVVTFGNKTAFNTIFVIGIGLMIAIIALSLTAKNYTFTKNKTKNANGQ
ncbi:MAG TPA: MFS transporter [Verrucomicrobiae bacterium]|nr:MFS transporter [Verrucomicrobiae bacterium]